MKQLVKCPHCGKDYSAHAIFIDDIKPFHDFDGNSDFFIDRCNFCQKCIFIRKIKGHDDILFYYPSTPYIDIPKEIAEFSPTSVEIYTQSLQAKAEKLDYIVGAGLRRTLEQLVTDYLLYVQNENQDEILKLKLHHRIEKLDKSFYAKSCAMIVKIIGNNEVHFASKYDLDVQCMIDCLNSLMKYMSGICRCQKADLQLEELKNRKL